MLHKIEVDQTELSFVGSWICWYRENKAADRAAKEALDKEHTDDLMPWWS